MAATLEKHSRAIPPMTPPMIAPVLFVEEAPVLEPPPPLAVSFADASVVEGVVGPDVLPGDASVDLNDDETPVVDVSFVLVVVVEDDCVVVELKSEVGEMR